MKATVVTDRDGQVVGFTRSAQADYRTREQGRPGEFRGGLMAGPDQQIHEVDVPDDFSVMPDASELHARVKKLVQKAR
jgi:hypothetical protein